MSARPYGLLGLYLDTTHSYLRRRCSSRLWGPPGRCGHRLPVVQPFCRPARLVRLEVSQVSFRQPRLVLSPATCPRHINMNDMGAPSPSSPSPSLHTRRQRRLAIALSLHMGQQRHGLALVVFSPTLSLRMR
jgi:hypothetical protein